MSNNVGVNITRSTFGPLTFGDDPGDSFFIALLAERGPIDVPTLAFSWSQFTSLFGGATPFADGTRYINDSGFTDLEINPTPGLFGNFVSGFFAWEGEVSYGRTRPGILASARRAGLSGNIDDRVLYVSFFDGSVQPVSVTNAKARPDWWAPSGSEWVSMDGVAAEASSQYEVGDLLP